MKIIKDKNFPKYKLLTYKDMNAYRARTETSESIPIEGCLLPHKLNNVFSYRFVTNFDASPVYIIPNCKPESPKAFYLPITIGDDFAVMELQKKAEKEYLMVYHNLSKIKNSKVEDIVTNHIKSQKDRDSNYKIEVIFGEEKELYIIDSIVTQEDQEKETIVINTSQIERIPKLSCYSLENGAKKSEHGLICVDYLDVSDDTDHELQLIPTKTYLEKVFKDLLRNP